MLPREFIEDPYAEGVRWFEEKAQAAIVSRTSVNLRSERDKHGRPCLLGQIDGYDVKIRYFWMWDVHVLVRAGGKWKRKRCFWSSWQFHASRMIGKLPECSG